MDFFSIHFLLVHLPIGKEGYDLSWIEAVGTLAGLLCNWMASREKISNYAYGLVNVTLFAIIFFQIQLYASLLLQLFFFVANLYGWYVWRRQPQQEGALHIRWLTRRQAGWWLFAIALAIAIMTCWIDVIFGALGRTTVALLRLLGYRAFSWVAPAPDAYPFWDASMTVLSVAAMILMTRKYVENWILWTLVNVISVAIFAVQGVLAMALEYFILLAIALSGVVTWTKRARENGAAPLR